MTNFFIVNEHYHDFSALERPDINLVSLTKGPVNIFHNERLKAEMLQRMKDSNICESDFVVVCGAGILNALAVLAMKEIVGVVNVALYNHHDKKYHMRHNI